MSMRVSISVLVISAALVVGSGAPAMAQSVRLLGDFKDWSAYTTSDNAGKLCFAISKPKSTEPMPDGYGEAYLYLTHRPNENVRYELNLVAGYGFALDSAAQVNIGGSRHALFTSADAAWLENSAQAENVAGIMRAGTTMVIEGTSVQGIKIAQSFSLSGVTAASRAIDAECR